LLSLIVAHPWKCAIAKGVCDLDKNPPAVPWFPTPHSPHSISIHLPPATPSPTPPPTGDHRRPPLPRFTSDPGDARHAQSDARRLPAPAPPDRSHRATERLPSRRRQVPPPSSLRLPPPAVFFFGASPSLLHPFPLAAPPCHDPTLTLELRVGRWFNGGGRWFNSGGRWANDGTRGARCPLPWTSQKFCPPQDRHRHGRRATTASEAELGSSL
jgi:hypothetical protein